MTSPYKSTAGLWITMTLVAVLVIYPLSIGPALWVFGRLKNPNWAGDVYHAFYAPILLACDSNKFVARTIDWYIDLWVT